MPVAVTATAYLASGWAQLRFPYDPPTISVVKSLPGATWDKAKKTWFLPLNALDLLGQRLPLIVRGAEPFRTINTLPHFAQNLRPYQVEAAQFLLSRLSGLLTMDPRTGKTPVGITVACALALNSVTNATLYVYPNAVRDEWVSQLKRWAGVNLYCIEGLKPVSDDIVRWACDQPHLSVGIHYEILDAHADSLARMLAGRMYSAIVDELHYCKNRKIDRTKVLWELVHSAACVGRYGLTGTPLRNRPRDLWAMFEFVGPKQGGSYWTFAQRYAAAHKDDLGHWDDSGESNLDELKVRLAAVSYRKTREEVAPWLPKMDLHVIKCAVSEKQLALYRSMEKAFAPQVKSLLQSDGTSGEAQLRELVKATSVTKIPTCLARAYEHTSRGVKVIVFAHHHETLGSAWDAFEKAKAKDPEAPAHFCAGGWMTPTKRREEIAKWKACPGPSILLANSLSSGIGIDLSDAETAIFLELEWVPSDLKQTMDRIQDVHLGKRKAPPIYEMLLVPDTVDAAMTAAVCNKLRAIAEVVGIDSETARVGSELRESGAGGTGLGLADTSQATVQAALQSIADRIMSLGADGMSDPADTEGLAAQLGDAFDDQEEESDDE